MRKHYLTYAIAKGNRKVVWGTGTTKKRSKTDADNWVAAWGHSQAKPKLRTIPCEYSVFHHVMLHGGMAVSFRIKDGVAYLDI
jgi:hypothetical protein